MVFFQSIDGLHIRNHKGDCAEKYSHERLRKQYPLANTMVAEQTFVWLNRYKKILAAMPKYRLISRRNRYTIRHWQIGSSPVLPGIRSEHTT